MSIRFKNVLFPTDFSDTATAALADAKALVRLFNARLHVIHVVDDAYQHWASFGPESMPVTPPPEELLSLGRSRMEKFANQFLADLAPIVTTHVALGRPFAEIVAYANEHQIDLIVMATHGRGVIAHALLGSTTERVVRKAPCAVLTIRVGAQAGAPRPKRDSS